MWCQRCLQVTFVSPAAFSATLASIARRGDIGRKMEDLEAIIALGGQGGPPLAREGSRSPASRVGIDGDVGMDEAGRDLLAMIDMQAVAEAPQQPARKKHKQRSWESAQHARDVRSLQVSQRKLASATMAKEQAQQIVATLTTVLPVVAQRLGLLVWRTAYLEQARISMWLGFAPTMRSDPTAWRT